MKLTSSKGNLIVDPTDAEIRKALEELNVERDGEGFVVLDGDETGFLQVSGDIRMDFDMECSEGTSRKLYRAMRDGFNVNEVVDALVGFRNGTFNCDDYGNWERIM